MNEKTIEYGKLMLMSMFSERTQGHIHNIANEIKEIIKEEAVDFLKTPQGQEVAQTIIDCITEGNEEPAKDKNNKKDTKVTIEF